MKKKLHDIDFTRALARGHVSYDATVGTWWEKQSADDAHKRAYRHAAEYTRDHLRKSLKAKIDGKAGAKAAPTSPLVVDYACGGGHFLLELARLMPEARIVGLDGSKKLLALTAARCEAAGITAAIVPGSKAFDAKGPRIRLVRTNLPNFKLPAGKADAVAFVFPNIAPGPDDQPLYDRNGYLNRADGAVAKLLARFREMDPEDEVTREKPDIAFDGYMTERVLSRNIRGFLKKSGLWIKVDYANALRNELTELSQWRCLFSECALELPIKGLKSEVLFNIRDNVFRRSSVILDVYHQTKDPSDKTGGYFITKFEAT
jgi:SAM-dependent methyltransferase